MNCFGKLGDFVTASHLGIGAILARPVNPPNREQTVMSELRELSMKEEMLQRLLAHTSTKKQASVRKELSAIRQQIGLFKALGFEIEPKVPS